MKKTQLILVWLLLACLACFAIPALATEAVVLGDDLYAFAVELEGTVITFPCELSVLTDMGWAARKAIDMEDTLNPNQYEMITFVKDKGNEEQSITIFCLNTDNRVKTVAECGLFGIDADNSFSNSTLKLKLAKDIALGANNLDEAIAAYGDPTDRYDGTDYVKLTYRMDSYQEIGLTFTAEQKLTSISVRNFIDFGEKSPISEELPAYLAEYVAPTELGDDMKSFNVEIGGELYALPAPISALEKNGWKMIKTRTDSIDARDYLTSGAEMMRSNKKVGFDLYNYGDFAVPTINASVCSVSASSWREEVTVVIPGGIKVGSTRDDFLAKAGDLFDEPTINSDKTIERYYYSEEGAYRRSLSVEIDIATNLVVEIRYGR